MDAETISAIYNLFIEGRISPSDLIYRLSRYDLRHEMTEDDFRKRIRLHRTVITEIRRYNNLPHGLQKKLHPFLHERYIKDYLYHCAAHRMNYSDFDFKRYIKTLIETHKIIERQYQQLADRRQFWNTVHEISESMQNA